MLKTSFFRTTLFRALLFLGVGLCLYVPAKWIVLRAETPADLTVGSKNFTESRLLAEMYALALENAGYRVRRRFDLGGTLIAHAALQKGEIDVYPEYTGTGLMNVLKQAPSRDESKAFDTLAREYQSRWRLRWLKPAEANNSQALVVTRETAETYRLYTLSRLAELVPRLRLAAIPEFTDREDGLKGLQRAYGGLRFREIRQYNNSLKYRVLQDRQADVTVAFTTDGELTSPELVVLADDRQFWPKYRVAPVIRQEALAAHPLASGALNRISAVLDTATLRQLNAKINQLGESNPNTHENPPDETDYSTVARQFLSSRGFL